MEHDMHKLTTLPNKIKLLTKTMRGTKTATVLVMVGTGSKYENKNNSGISHFVEHMFFKGTKKRPNTLSITSEIDGIGADFNAFTSKEYTGYWIKADCKKINIALDVLGDMLLNSKFDKKEIEREKGVIVEEINMYEDNPMMHIEDVFENLLYGDTPAGRDIYGSRKSVMSFSRSDFVEYFNSQYCPGNISVCVIGNTESQEVIKKRVNRCFSSKVFNKRGDNFVQKKRVNEIQEKPDVIIEYKKTDQSNISLGLRTFGYNSKKRYALKLLSVILGGSMSSRLFINLRERHGLAYYVRTISENYTDSGYLTTQAGVPVNKINKAVEIILNEYKKIKKYKISDIELKRAKDLLSGKIAIQMESSDNLANWYGRQIVLCGSNKSDIKTPDQYLGLIKKVTREDIREVANETMVNNGLNLAVIGPYKNEARFKKLLKI